MSGLRSIKRDALAVMQDRFGISESFFSVRSSHVYGLLRFLFPRFERKLALFVRLYDSKDGLFVSVRREVEEPDTFSNVLKGILEREAQKTYLGQVLAAPKTTTTAA